MIIEVVIVSEVLVEVIMIMPSIVPVPIPRATIPGHMTITLPVAIVS